MTTNDPYARQQSMSLLPTSSTSVPPAFPPSAHHIRSEMALRHAHPSSDDVAHPDRLCLYAALAAGDSDEEVRDCSVAKEKVRDVHSTDDQDVAAGRLDDANASC